MRRLVGPSALCRVTSKTQRVKRWVIWCSEVASLLSSTQAWAVLGYNLVRREASQAAVAHQRAPNEVSFKFACHFIANQMAVMAGALSPAHTPRRLAELRGCIGVMFIEKRPRPSRPRAVKISKTRFPVNRNAAPLK
ncbi:hypothetical protein BFG06_06235 [Aeromonas caviae]|nr:hypothetical protein BFG06_06235 [Aeromonas caviae]